MAGLYIGIWVITSMSRRMEDKSLTTIIVLKALSIIQTLEHTLLVLRTVNLLDTRTKSARKLCRPLACVVWLYMKGAECVPGIMRKVFLRKGGVDNSRRNLQSKV